MSIVEQARAELALVNFGEDDSRVMIEIVEKFLDQWDSGGAVAEALPILIRCIAGKPLAPLSGEGEEWMAVGHDTLQNKRCSTVFKEIKTDRAYNIDEPGRPAITFPYYPEKAEVKPPVMEFEVG